MSETLYNESNRAREFFDTHIVPPKDYEEYIKQQLDTWRQAAKQAADTGVPIKPMWVRSNGNDSTEFRTHVGYWMPVDDSMRLDAAIDIRSQGGFSDIEVHLPAEDGWHEPVVAFREAYTLSSLARALDFVDESLQLG